MIYICKTIAIVERYNTISTPCFIEFLSTLFPIHQWWMILNDLKCVSHRIFVSAKRKVHHLVSALSTDFSNDDQNHTQLSYSNYASQTDLSQCRAHFKFKYRYIYNAVFMHINVLSRCKNLI